MCIGKSVPTNTSRCTVAMAADASSNTVCIAFWPTILTTNVVEYSQTGSDSLPVASASATTYPWNSE